MESEVAGAFKRKNISVERCKKVKEKPLRRLARLVRG